MKFSIIIATCGRPERLRTTLDAVATACDCAGGGHELTVVDNHPDYTAVPVVEEFARKGVLPVRCLRSAPRSKSAALNAGVAAAKHDWLAFTDDDTLPDERWLAEGAVFAQANACRIFGGHIVPGRVDRRLPRWLTPGRSGRVPEIGVEVQYDPLPASGRLPRGATAPFGANMFARRAVFDEHGGYDERLWDLCAGMWPVGCEDSEFGHRLHEREEPVGYCREARVVHPVNYDRCSLRLHVHRAFCEGWRQPLIFFDPCCPWLEKYRLRLLMRHAARLVADGIRVDVAGAAHHAVEMARVSGAIAGRISSAHRRRAEQVGQVARDARQTRIQ